ncbi:MAG: thiamine-phosphate pyrophosphorylase [Candidatus Omnitrophica bacterium]|nr:thiamine-phosphate pyrophosphorylase [Candidatus Omnitrophota bacterium]
MDKGVYRIIDANLNRALEAVRVAEDMARFWKSDKKATGRLKDLRHDIFAAVKTLRAEYIEELLSARDSVGDIGTRTTCSERLKESPMDIFLANVQRGKESLRVLEEVLKLFDSGASGKMKKLRFKLYDIEKNIAGAVIRKKN